MVRLSTTSANDLRLRLLSPTLAIPPGVDASASNLRFIGKIQALSREAAGRTNRSQVQTLDSVLKALPFTSPSVF